MSHPILPNVQLQPRDLTLIRALTEQFAMLSSEQIGDLLGAANLRTLNDRLKKLRDAGYLSVRTLAKFGSARQLGYFLGPTAIALSTDPTERRLASAARTHAAQLKASGLAHRMLVDAIHIRFMTASRTHPEYRLHTWVDQYSPWWAEFQQYGVPVQADGYAEYLLLLHFDTLATVFLEADCGTETGTVLEDKVRRYVQYARSGLHQQLFAARGFRVLFVMSSELRVTNLLALMTDVPRDLFWVTTAERFTRSALFEEHWRRPNVEGIYSLRHHL